MDRLVRVDLEWGERPLADVLDELERLAAAAPGGVLLDRVPDGAWAAGAVALAVRVARRSGFTPVLVQGRAPC
ncbi:hypothetical protein [Phytohabitans rumicis]|uniref:Uncharacterized protein n=1 Tax=Phytohabitans rumicis TaxID=1076125 RepID=A0A6V8KVI5_9ACTN|nr:hypothetical protein [Phytohabitans rumicis]GFJ89093.1 hypothetical protein Prum_027350 [Phytohabitans rumicis]